MAVVAALIVGVVALVPHIGSNIAEDIQYEICRVAGLNCAAAIQAERYAPDDPCVLSQDDGSADAGVTVFSVHVGSKLSYTVKKLGNGKFEVTLRGGADVGLAGELGGHADVSVGKDTVGVDLSAEGQVGLGAEVGDTYEVDTQQQANDLVSWAERQAENDAPGPVGTVMSIYNHFAGPSYSPPDVNSTYYEAGVQASGSASAGAGVGYAGVSGSVKGYLGYKLDHDTGERTYYFKVGADVAGNAGLVVGPSVSGSAGGEVVVSYTTDKDGKPESAGFEATGEYSGGASAGLNLEGDNLEAITDKLESLEATGGHETGHAYSVIGELDLTDPDNLAAVQGVVKSLGGDGSVTGALSSLRDQLDSQGKLAVSTYSLGSDKYGADVGGGVGVKFALEGEVADSTQQVESSQFRVPGVGFVDRPGCGK